MHRKRPVATPLRLVKNPGASIYKVYFSSDLSFVYGISQLFLFLCVQMFKLKGLNDEMSEQMELLRREKKSLEGWFLILVC